MRRLFALVAIRYGLITATFLTDIAQETVMGYSSEEKRAIREDERERQKERTWGQLKGCCVTAFVVLLFLVVIISYINSLPTAK